MTYTVQEEVLENSYESEITGDSTTGFIVTNSRTPETIEVSASKTWDDANNQDGKRPSNITLRLLADGVEVASKELSQAENWKWTFTNLPKYKLGGQKINYVVTEDAMEDYSCQVSSYDFTNTHIPEKTFLQVTKAWNDGDNQDGLRPQSVTIKLLADGQDTGRTLELNGDNLWTGTFTEIDVYKPGAVGQKVTYTVEEEAIGNGYETVITGDQVKGYVVTNSRIPETIALSGSKTWDDQNNKDRIRPKYITIRLYADGEETQSKEISQADGWKWTFKDLPKYKDGKEITYTIGEDSIPGYTSKIDGFNITNTHKPKDPVKPKDPEETEPRLPEETEPKKPEETEVKTDTQPKPEEKREIKVTKVWDDKDNKAGHRPKEVFVKLYADDKNTGQFLVLKAENNWKGTFKDLDKTKEGKEITYTIEEKPVAKYTNKVTGTMDKGFTITNTYSPSIKGIPKTGDDFNGLKWALVGLASLGALVYTRKKNPRNKE